MTPAAWDVPEGRYIALAGARRAFVREAGRPGAPPLLLLHGLGATGGLNWAGMFGCLSSRFRVIALDLPGHGRGPRVRRFLLEDCADDAAAVLDALDIGNCIAIGYSMGGPVAMLLWQRHRALVSGLVLVATSRNFRGHPAEQLAFDALATLTAAPIPMRLPFRIPIPAGLLGRAVPPLARMEWGMDELRHHQRRAVLQAATAVGQFSAHGWVDQIDVPVAVVATTNDRMVPITRQARLAMSIPTAVLHPVDAGHIQVGPFLNTKLRNTVNQACIEVAERAARWHEEPEPDQATRPLPA